jgi:hypothetical protein
MSDPAIPQEILLVCPRCETASLEFVPSKRETKGRLIWGAAQRLRKGNTDAHHLGYAQHH